MAGLTTALAIAAVLVAIGLPLSLLLTRHELCLGFGPYVGLVLAPVVGIAVFAIYGAALYAAGGAVKDGLTALWVGVVLEWCVLAWLVYRRRHVLTLPRTNVLLALEGLAGLVVVVGVYAWPFLNDPNLVFWHYAGSDGYIYMRIAEQVGWVGTAQAPSVGVFNGDAGMVAEEILGFHSGVFVDKPGTMAALAGLAAALGKLPHETYSPLVLNAVGMLYLALSVFAASIGLPPWLRPPFAALAALAPSAWMMAMETFLGNVLALPMFPLILGLLGATLGLRSAVLCGLAVAAEAVLFPDGFAALLGVCAPYVLYSLFQSWRAGKVATRARAVAVALVVAAACLTPFGGMLPKSMLQRVINVAPREFVTSGPAALQSSALHVVSNISWIWPAFNLSTIPPNDLTRRDALFALALAAFAAIYLGWSIRVRRIDSLWWYTLVLAVLLVVGVYGGVFLSGYELYRALAVFAFVPLALIFALPVSLARAADRFRVGPPLLLASVAAVALLGRFVFTDLSQFELGYSGHFPGADYTLSDIVDRRKVAELSAQHSIVMSGETPTFTALANVLMLFSSSHPGVPDSDRKFVFFRPVDPPGTQYQADLVLFNRRYLDVWMPDTNATSTRYASTDFVVLDNDLVPFFDNDTFSPNSVLPRKMTEDAHVPFWRILDHQTEVDFYSRQERDVELQISTDATQQTTSLSIAMDEGQAARLPISGESTARLTLHASVGLHRLVVSTPDPARPAIVTGWRIVGRR